MRNGDSAPWQLYDLHTDIGEQSDLASARSDIVDEIVALLQRDGLLPGGGE